MPNDFTSIADVLVQKAVPALREMSIMPRTVNRELEQGFRSRYTSVKVVIPVAQEAEDVVPGPTPPATAGVTPTSVNVSLTEWKGKAFYIDDDEQRQKVVRDKYMPAQATEALRAVVNSADNFILGLYKHIYGFRGTPGTTPFGTNVGVSDVSGVRAVLEKQLCPKNPRFMILDPDAEASAMDLRPFHDMSMSGDPSVILEGQINRKFGFTWLMDQNMPYHTAGTGADILVNDPGAALAVGDKTVPIDSVTGGTLVVGDIVSFAGHNQSYVVTEAVADVTSANMKIEPGLQAVPGDGEAVALKASHQVNLATQRDWCAFASALPEVDDEEGKFLVWRPVIDEISGLAVRLTIQREYMRTRYQWDALFGAQVVRRELGARLAG